jgi:hypothetical protein
MRTLQELSGAARVLLRTSEDGEYLDTGEAVEILEELARWTEARPWTRAALERLARAVFGAHEYPMDPGESVRVKCGGLPTNGIEIRCREDEDYGPVVEVVVGPFQTVHLDVPGVVQIGDAR